MLSVFSKINQFTIHIMAFGLEKTIVIIELMENYIDRIRPVEELRDKLDISYKIDNQSVIPFKI